MNTIGLSLGGRKVLRILNYPYTGVLLKLIQSNLLWGERAFITVTSYRKGYIMQPTKMSLRETILCHEMNTKYELLYFPATKSRYNFDINEFFCFHNISSLVCFLKLPDRSPCNNRRTNLFYSCYLLSPILA